MRPRFASATFRGSAPQGGADGTRERVVRRRPYIIVYEIDDSKQDVIILNVLHGARRR